MSLAPARPQPEAEDEGVVFDVDTFAVHDGPGIRMAVYLKGCRLRCRWCHSPESQFAKPEVIFIRDRCAFCGACAAACDEGRHAVAEGSHEIRRRVCKRCFRCVEACPAGALEVKGEVVRAGDIVARAGRMRPFFEHSGGGVTLTGGEVTQQPDFAEAILEGLGAERIHAAIETSGACEWRTLHRLVRLSDLVMYDLKLIDDDEHRRWTRATNRSVLKNARRLGAECPGKVEVRLPLIPGITDTDANVRAVFAFMREAGLDTVTLLPYNPSAPAKYEWLGRPYEVDGEPQSAERLAATAELARDAGLKCAVG